MDGSSKELVSAALKSAAAHAPDRMIWIEEHADLCFIRIETFKDYFYGKTAPGMDPWRRMVCHFGPGFANTSLNPVGIHCIRSDDHDLIAAGEALKAFKAAAPILRGLLKDMERADNVTPMKGAG
jgi:hypothetical protein